MQLIESLSQALRRAARALRRSPGYTLAVVLSLALGLGANTAMFTIIDAVLLRPLPYPRSEELLTVGQAFKSGMVWGLYGNDPVAWASGSHTIQSLARFTSAYATVAGGAATEYVAGGHATANLLAVLHAHTERGRWFTDDDARTGAPPVVVLSHELWQRQFAGDTGLVGRTLQMYEAPATVIGVMPAGAGLPLGAQFWLPAGGDLGMGQVVARPRPGVSIADVQSELTRLSPTIERMRRTDPGYHLVVESLHDQLYGSARPLLQLLFGAVLLLLLIACANVANLSLARTLERRRELALRATLGASRWALASEVVSENAVLAAAGAALGILLGIWTTRLFVALSPADFARPSGIAVGRSGLLFAGVGAICTALMISVAPALAAARGDLQPVLGQGGVRAGRGRVAHRVRRVLVAGQLAIALLLITGAGLIVRSVARLTSVDLGFKPQGIAIANISLVGGRYREKQRVSAFHDDLQDRLKAVPGVQSVAVGPAPLVAGRGEGLREGFDMIMGHRDTTRADGSSPLVFVKFVSPSYFETYRIPIRAGRGLLASDDSVAPAVAVVNGTAARLYFGNEPAIGGRISDGNGFLSGGRPLTVVGIVDNVRQRDVTLSASPEIFLPVAQNQRGPRANVAARTSGDPRALLPIIRGILRDIDPALGTTRLTTMQAVVDESLAPHRFLLLLLTSFAGLALGLASLGLYAVVAYLVAQRTQEIGVRMALGAQRSNVLGMVLRDGMSLVVAGVVIGVPAAYALSRVLTSFLYEVSPRDAGALITAPLVLALVALVAAYIPARRATRVDPMVALRHE
jgi:putative ABC transport system permease protein